MKWSGGILAVLLMAVDLSTSVRARLDYGSEMSRYNRRRGQYLQPQYSDRYSRYRHHHQQSSEEQSPFAQRQQRENYQRQRRQRQQELRQSQYQEQEYPRHRYHRQKHTEERHRRGRHQNQAARRPKKTPKTPDSEFFSNFQMPFLSVEEVFIKDANTTDANPAFRSGDLASSPSNDHESYPAQLIQEFDKLADKQLYVNESELMDLERGDFGQMNPKKVFSIFKITTDGSTPFEQEKNSEIIYDSRGIPSEVVVYLDDDDEDPMDHSESRLDNHAKSYRNNRHAYTSGGRRASGIESYDEEPVEYEEYEDEDYEDHEPVKSRAGSNHVTFSGEDALKRTYHSTHGGGSSYHSDHGGYDDIALSRDHHGGGGGGGYSDHHDSGGHGFVDHHISSGGYHDDHDAGYTPHKKPGPFGYGKPNYKCEYAKETLYVTKTDYKFSKKCYKILKVQCKTKYDVGKKIGYKKVCNEFSITKCRTIYATKFKTKCWLVYKKKCEDSYKTKVDWVYKEKCSTTYDKECSGHGYHKQCHDVPKEICKQVPEKVEKQIKSVKCKKVPDKKCKDVPFFVPKKECKDFPRTVCTQDPINVKKDVPKKVCFTVPIEKCVKVPKEVLVHIPKTVKKKVCVSTKAHDDHAVHGAVSYHDDHGGGGGHGGGYHDDHDDHGGYSSNVHHFRSNLAQHKVLDEGILLPPEDALNEGGSSEQFTAVDPYKGLSQSGPLEPPIKYEKVLTSSYERTPRQTSPYGKASSYGRRTRNGRKEDGEGTSASVGIGFPSFGDFQIG